MKILTTLTAAALLVGAPALALSPQEAYRNQQDANRAETAECLKHWHTADFEKASRGYHASRYKIHGNADITIHHIDEVRYYGKNHLRCETTFLGKVHRPTQYGFTYVPEGGELVRYSVHEGLKAAGGGDLVTRWVEAVPVGTFRAPDYWSRTYPNQIRW